MNQSRRDFIRKSSALGISGFLPFNKNIFEMNKKIKTAHIGVGGMGLNDLKAISSHKNVYGSGELNFLTDAIHKFILKDNEFLNKNINEVEYENLYNIQKFYLEEINIFPKEKIYITDKAPLNFRWIGFIKLLFPNSKVVHCVREPMDICFSNYKNAFSANSLGFL